jgi:hypothetical protein
MVPALRSLALHKGRHSACIRKLSAWLENACIDTRFRFLARLVVIIAAAFPLAAFFQPLYGDYAAPGGSRIGQALDAQARSQLYFGVGQR